MTVRLSKEEHKARVAVWIPLSELFLDTQLAESDWWRIAEQLAQSPFSEDKLEDIYSDEVAPVLVHNLLCVAGEWAGFDQEWLARTLTAKHEPLFPLPILGPAMKSIYTWGTRQDMDRVMERVRLLREPNIPTAIVSNKVPDDEDMLSFVIYRLSTFAPVARLFNDQNESNRNADQSFLNAAIKPFEITDVVHINGMTVGGMRVTADKKRIQISDVYLFPPYFLQKLDEVLQAVCKRYQSDARSISLELLRIESFEGLAEQYGFKAGNVESPGTTLCFHLDDKMNL